MPVAFSSSVLGDIKRLSTHSAVYGLVGGSSGAVSMMLVPLYGHLFTPEEFGQFQLAQLWLSIAATVRDWDSRRLISSFFMTILQKKNVDERWE